MHGMAKLVKKKQRRPVFFVTGFLFIMTALLLTACGTPQISSVHANSNSTTFTSNVTATGTVAVDTNVGTSVPNTFDPANTPTPSTSTTTQSAAPFSQIRMVNTVVGWALTKNAIVRTMDGGQTWTNVTPVSTPLHTASRGDFIDEQNAWVVTTQGDSTGTVYVLHTTDGGQSWTTSTFSDPDALVGDPPHFLNAQDGFVALVNQNTVGMGHSMDDIFATTNGGQTWTKVLDSMNSAAVGVNEQGMETGISFTNPGVGYLTAGTYAAKIYLYRTTDSGESWTAENLAVPAGSPSTQYQTTPPILSGNDGVLPVLGDQTIDLYHTTDNGLTWTSTDELHFAASQVNAADMQHFWASNSNGVIYATSNGGTSWDEVAQTGQNIGGMSFINVSDGWLISPTSPLLMHTTDGGHTWQTINYTIQ